jgi:hypothetical protein
MGYIESEKESTALERVPYVVFDRRDPSRFVAGTAATWMGAREKGASKLSIKPEHVWAVLILEGETSEQAVARGVALLSRWDNDGGEK